MCAVPQHALGVGTRYSVYSGALRPLPIIMSWSKIVVRYMSTNMVQILPRAIRRQGYIFLEGQEAAGRPSGRPSGVAGDGRVKASQHIPQAER